MMRCGISCGRKFLQAANRLGLFPDQELMLASNSKSPTPHKRYSPLEASKFVEAYEALGEDLEAPWLSLKSLEMRLNKLTYGKTLEVIELRKDLKKLHNAPKEKTLKVVELRKDLKDKTTRILKLNKRFNEKTIEILHLRKDLEGKTTDILELRKIVKTLVLHQKSVTNRLSALETETDK